MDLNPIENFFQQVGQKLERQVVGRGILKGSFTEFSTHVKELKEWFGEKIDLSKTEKSNSAPQT